MRSGSGFFVRALTTGVTIRGRIVATAQEFTVVHQRAMEGKALLQTVGIRMAQAKPTTDPAMAPAFVVFFHSVPKTYGARKKPEIAPQERD